MGPFKRVHFRVPFLPGFMVSFSGGGTTTLFRTPNWSKWPHLGQYGHIGAPQGSPGPQGSLEGALRGAGGPVLELLEVLSRVSECSRCCKGAQHCCHQ